MIEINGTLLQEALRILGERLRLKRADQVQLIICGGSALIAMDLISRSTADVDVLAIISSDGVPQAPVPFPAMLTEALIDVSTLLGLPEDWLNNGPSRDSGGIFQCGLPDGLLERAHRKDFGSHLQVFFIDRVDQVFLKVFAAADSLGVHVDDLIALNPTPEEMEAAAQWCMTHDPSEGFRSILKSMFDQLGYSDVAERL